MELVTLLVIAGVAALAATGAYLVGLLAQRQQARSELRADWWESFERDFRAYASSRRLKQE